MNIKDLNRNHLIKSIKKTIADNYISNSLKDFAEGLATWYNALTIEQAETICITEDEYENTFDIINDESDAVEYYYRYVMEDVTGDVESQEAFKQEMYDYDLEMKRRAFAHNC